MKKNVFVLREFPLQIASLSNGEHDFIPKLRHCVDGGNFYPISRMHVFQSLSDTFPSDVFCTKKKASGRLAGFGITSHLGWGDMQRSENVETTIVHKRIHCTRASYDTTASKPNTHAWKVSVELCVYQWQCRQYRFKKVYVGPSPSI